MAHLSLSTNLHNMKYVGIILLLLVCVSCNNEADDKTIQFDNENLIRTIQQEGRAIGLADYLGKPNSFKIHDSMIFVVDRWEHAFVDVYSMGSKSCINSFGARGRGNGELLSVSSIEIDESTNSVWLFDITMSRFHCFDIDEIAGMQKIKPIRSLGFSATLKGIYNPKVINDTMIVATNIFSKDRLWFMNDQGEFLFKRGRIPLDDNNVPGIILAQAYSGVSEYSKQHQKVVLANRYSDMMEIYHTNGELFKIIRGPFIYEPQFEIDEYEKQPVFAQRDEMRLGYIDVTFSSQRIYALFSGRTRSEFPGIANTGKYVYVFNWDGEIIERIEFDRDVIDIEYNEGSKTIYGLQINPFPEIYIFKTGE